MGETNELVIAHELYKTLGSSNKLRQKHYQDLFRSEIKEKTLEAIRESTNKAWVLGSDYFKDKIEAQLYRPASPKPKGGDRKSKAYKTNRA